MPVIKHELAPDLTIYEGHVIEGLRLIPDKSVQCIATSDPYWGLRDYGTGAWEGGDPDCDHGQGPDRLEREYAAQSTLVGPTTNQVAAAVAKTTKEVCPKCGARRVNNMDVDWPEVTYSPMPGLAPIMVPVWRGAYGLEPTPEMYVGHSVLIRRELWRVMRDDATHWLNLGDTYAGSRCGPAGDEVTGRHVVQTDDFIKSKRGGPRWGGGDVGVPGLPAKNLVGIPWRVAFALQADGWYVRSAPPWIKGNPMPESVTDRPGTAHENIFLLAKSERYFYDDDAVKVGMIKGAAGSTFTKGKTAVNGLGRVSQADREDNPTGRNRRTNDWWTKSLDIAISRLTDYLFHLHHVKEHGGLLTDEGGSPLGFMVNTKPFSEAHFAVWPEDLVEPMILAGTSPKACPKCLAPWRRVTGEPIPIDGKGSGNKERKIATDGERSRTNSHMGSSIPWQPTAIPTVDWQPTCSCEGNDGTGKCVVLDPFGGSMTTVRVALEHGRAGVSCELNPEYIAMGIRARLDNAQTSLLGQM